MALLRVIRRWHFREGMSIREIVRRTGLARNTVRKYLSGDIVDPRYERRSPPGKLAEYKETLSVWLHRESHRPRKGRLTVKRLYHDLVDLGYEGSYDRVCVFARQWKRERQEAERTAGKNSYIPLKFSPGEAFQFDWGEDYIVVGGTNTKLQLAHFKLCHSRAFMLRAYMSQSHEMLFDAHAHAFSVFGGIPQRGIYDNMKTAVDKVGRGKERQVNKRFEAMASHYLIDTDFCSPAAGWEKGQVEKAVRDARTSLWKEAPEFSSLEHLNDWLAERCVALWHEQPHPEQKPLTIADCWKHEKAHLMPEPPAFDGFVEHSKRVSSTSLVTFDNNRYSVPASFANRPVSLRVYVDRLVMVADTGVIAEHRRLFSRGHKEAGKTVYDWRHYLPVVQRKPGALRNGAPFEDLPDAFRQLQASLLKRKGGDREMADILALILLYDEELVIDAVREAIKAGKASKQHVLNCLGRLQDSPPPEPLVPPPALRLVTEPLADTARYDHLRERQP